MPLARSLFWTTLNWYWFSHLTLSKTTNRCITRNVKDVLWRGILAFSDRCSDPIFCQVDVDRLTWLLERSLWSYNHQTAFRERPSSFSSFLWVVSLSRLLAVFIPTSKFSPLHSLWPTLPHAPSSLKPLQQISKPFCIRSLSLRRCPLRREEKKRHPPPPPPPPH